MESERTVRGERHDRFLGLLSVQEVYPNKIGVWVGVSPPLDWVALGQYAIL
jgi:hypothetical protein